MRIVCTGGRDYKNAEHIDGVLNGFVDVTEVYVGDCPTGVDLLVRGWCQMNDVLFRMFEADWNKHRRAAGPIRNREMLQAAGTDALVIAFPGGRGTADCTRQAKMLGMIVRSESIQKEQP